VNGEISYSGIQESKKSLVEEEESKVLEKREMKLFLIQE